MTTTVNTKDQVTIPKSLRRKYGFGSGTKVVWVERDGELIPRPVRTAQQLYGSLRLAPGQHSMARLLLDERRLAREHEDV
jgi:AbrB family looped-hinge helix DNA binding protein